MISFINNIEYLTIKHDCVIIPGWGAFIAQYSHAYINADNQFIAPKRTLSFNASINHNDGLLANSIMRKENLTYDSALSIISNEVLALKKQLHCGGEVSIGRLGFFISNDEGQICFEPYTNTMACDDFFGLNTLTLCPIEKVVATAKENVVNLNTDIEDYNDNNNVVYLPISRNIFRIVASIAILIGLLFVLSTPIIVDNHQEYASLNILASKQKAIQEINDRADLYITIPADEIVIEKKVNDKIIASTPTKIDSATEPTVQVERPKAESGRFYVIVASLHTKALAERHIRRANDSRMQILEKDGKFRIYIASTATSDEAYAIINNRDFRTNHGDAWVCRK